MTQTLKLCTWNLQVGLQLETIVAALGQQQDFAGLDLLALQEASVHAGREDAQVIASALGSTYHCFQVTADMLGEYQQANALVWNTRRLQLERKESVKLPSAREIPTLSRRERALIRVVSSAPQRISLVAEGTLLDGDSNANAATTLRVYSAHLDVIGFAHKREQFFHILKDMRTRPPVDLTILAGDLNTFKFRARPTWRELSAAAEAQGLLDLTSDIRWTHWVPRLRMKQKLDAIFVGRSRLLHYRAWSLDIRGSDHIPVFAEVTLED